MNIKVKAALDAAVVVGACFAGAAVLGLGLTYVPYVALALVVAGLYWMAYQFCLDTIKVEQTRQAAEENLRKITAEKEANRVS